MADDELEPDTVFCPPKTPTLVGCLHCHEVFESYLIEWRIHTKADGSKQGFWSCPTPNCGGVGFGCDMLPIDRDWVDEEGNRMWCEVDDEDEEGDYEDEMDDEWDETQSRDENDRPGEEDIPF